jgi:hypothetical protein
MIDLDTNDWKPTKLEWFLIAVVAGLFVALVIWAAKHGVIKV